MLADLGELLATIPTVEFDKLSSILDKLNDDSMVVILEVAPAQEATVFKKRFSVKGKQFVVVAVTV